MKSLILALPDDLGLTARIDAGNTGLLPSSTRAVEVKFHEWILCTASSLLVAAEKPNNDPIRQVLF
ncbi:unnamed protein product [Prunus armeniaca]|uniref:Uncharacterized protein n=1 Tax=Prunus armeniaca TaxID=36596 RepID=A0A6J5X5Y1_PRUAR|nr:unnamed protein product [Prunus armeniaca]CAB4307415.1 unnamed protein product [Prunus armeniaca]